jgi:hypothetical protein
MLHCCSHQVWIDIFQLDKHHTGTGQTSLGIGQWDMRCKEPHPVLPKSVQQGNRGTRKSCYPQCGHCKWLVGRELPHPTDRKIPADTEICTARRVPMRCKYHLHTRVLCTAENYYYQPGIEVLMKDRGYMPNCCWLQRSVGKCLQGKYHIEIALSELGNIQQDMLHTAQRLVLR